MSKRKCCPPPCPPKVCARAVICGCTGAEGASVTATGPGGFNQSGATDSTGWWCHDTTTPGTYSVTLTYGTYTATKTVTVGTACTSYSATFLIDFDPFYLTTGLGTVTLTHTGLGWFGTRTVSVSTTNWQRDAYGNCVGTAGTYGVTIQYGLFCTGSGWLLEVGAFVVVFFIPAPAEYYMPDSTDITCIARLTGSGTVSMPASCSLPFVLSGVIPSTWTVLGANPIAALDSGTVVIIP